DLDAGIDTLVVSFISYDAQEIVVDIKANEEITLNVELLPATLEIGGVEVVAQANRESEAMLLLDQRNAEGISEGISSTRMSSLGISDAAGATSKISGATQNEGSGDVYIRGLGDRYLTTTMNGLPIPSDDVEKKNIDLNLFSTDIIKNVGINKTYLASTYGDQASGSVNIASKTSSDKIAVGLGTGANTNVFTNGIFSDFKTTQNWSDVSFGFYDKPYSTVDAVTNQSWNSGTRNLPVDMDFSVLAGKEWEKFSFFATLSHFTEADFQTGVYRKYRSNVLDNDFNDVEEFTTTENTTGLVNLAYDLNNKNSLNFNSLIVLKTIDQLYEQGRNGEGYVFDQDPQEDGAFVRDQNLKQTSMYVNQLLGSHKLHDKHTLEWAAGYNLVIADEPNRIRNEVNILDVNTVQFAHVGDFQQRKSSQELKDTEINGYLKDEFKLFDEETKKMKLNFGGNFRMKERDFSSLFVGVRAKNQQVTSIDNLDEALINDALYQSGGLILKDNRKPDTYNALLYAFAGYVDFGVELEKWSGSVGVRYERDEIDVDWGVSNYPGRDGSQSNTYDNILAAINTKYQLTEKSSLRFAASKTVTLPEFKELAPFEYVSPTGRVTGGNPDLKHSENYNFDIKWEMYPDRKELISVTAFFKQINDPINMAQTRGSSGNFYFDNTGEKANVYGIEAEARLGIIKAETTEQPGLDLIVNATKMWFNQDLLEDFQYNNKTESDLQGAAGFIFNGALSYSNNKENDFFATVSANYSSDKIFALGAPEDKENSDKYFNSAIIEKGFTTIDLVISKQFSKRIGVKISGKNLLDPEIKQTQEITPFTTGETTNETVLSYKKGISLSLGITINLNN
ncbi:MAG: TonB-dependent receptor, partial [Prolixibacteraceae bacterium]|nr:TonB-dependent receptor [Prolixibacteraceae bacterium]